jgi:outer membrane protein OmpA-like peptidoglycan-associated protein
LISQGVNESVVSFKGFGETKPKFPNTTDANRAKNRRTEVKIKQL